MKPLGFKEKRDLFFQFLILFFITAGIFLLALFFTQQTKSDVVSDQEKELYKEFAGFEKSKPAIIRLIDTVTAEANNIITQNASGSFATQNANGLINDFISNGNINLANNPFLGNITDLLKLYVNTTADKKGSDDQKIEVEKDIMDCKNDLKDKKFDKMLNRQSATPGDETFNIKSADFKFSLPFLLL